MNSNCDITKLPEKYQACAKEFKEHFHALEQAQTPLDKNRVFNELGGVKILCRSDFANSPSYRLNSEEVSYCLQEGIEIIDNHQPIRIEKDEDGEILGIKAYNKAQEEVAIEANTVIIATGINQGERPKSSNNISVWGICTPNITAAS